MPDTANHPWRLTDRVRTEDGLVAVHVLGSGPPIVLTHGTPSWSYLWRDIAGELATEHTVYLWDLLGYGDSEAEDGSPPSVALHARTLAALVKHWDLTNPVLVGHDIGGATVLRAHLLEGAPAARIALLDAAVLDSWVTPVAEHMRRHLDAYRTMPAGVFGELIAAHLRTATHAPLPAETTKAYLDRYAGAEGQRRWLTHVEHFDRRDTEPVQRRLTELTVPVRVLWGEHDQWLPVETGRRLAEAIPTATFTMVAAAGHFLTEDQPAEITRLLAEFC